MEAWDTIRPEAGPNDDYPAATPPSHQGFPAGFLPHLNDLVVRYRRRVLEHCTQRGLTVEAAADVAQDVFFRMARDRHRLEARYPVTSWLHRFTEQAITEYYHHRLHRR